MKVTHRDQIPLLSPAPLFHDSSDGQNRETRPISDPSVPQLSKSKSNGQSRDIETTTDLVQNANSEQLFEPSTDTETASEPMPQPPSRQSDTPSTVEVNDPTTKKIAQNEPSHSRGGNYKLRSYPKPNYSEFYRY